MSIEDRHEGVPLDEIELLSERAYIRWIRSGTFHDFDGKAIILGVIEMMKGMEYHFAHYSDLHEKISTNVMKLAQQMESGEIDEPFLMIEEPEIYQALLHELTAYINRVGQFYYFRKSAVVLDIVGSCLSNTPILEKFVYLRNKNSAHRALDYPLTKDDYETTRDQAMIMLPHRGLFDANGHFTIDIPKSDNDGRVHVCVTKEHSLLMNECYAIFDAFLQ